MAQAGKLRRLGMTKDDVERMFFLAILNRGGHVTDTGARKIREEVARALNISPSMVHIYTGDVPPVHRFGAYGPDYLVIMEDETANVFHRYHVNPVSYIKLVCREHSRRAVKMAVQRFLEGTAHFPKTANPTHLGRFKGAVGAMLRDYGATEDLINSGSLANIIMVSYGLESRFINGIDHVCSVFPANGEEATLMYEEAKVPEEEYGDWLLSRVGEPVGCGWEEEEGWQ